MERTVPRGQGEVTWRRNEWGRSASNRFRGGVRHSGLGEFPHLTVLHPAPDNDRIKL